MITCYQYNVQNLFHQYLAQLASKANHCVVLKTCRRLEIYQGRGRVDRATVEHLFRVVSGLESPIIGDSAIQNQVKLAYLNAAQQNQLDKSLHRLFQMALQTGKMVRSATNIGKGAVSYANAIYYIIKKNEKTSTHHHIVIIGINKITHDITKFLKSSGYNHITIINRSISKGEEFAQQWQVNFQPLMYLTEVFQSADVVVAATAAPTSFISARHFHLTKSYVVIDVGVPANICPDVLWFENIRYYGIDNIEKQLKDSFYNRKTEILHAENIIAEMIQKFMSWQEINVPKYYADAFVAQPEKLNSSRITVSSYLNYKLQA